ncbi:hypothetical protein [Geopseudomonas aromaticivorans]
MKRKTGATRNSSWLKKLGIDSIQTIWDNSEAGRVVPFNRAIQTAAIAMATGYLIGSATSQVSYDEMRLAATSPPSVAHVLIDGQQSHVNPMTLLVAADTSPNYVNTQEVVLNKQFRSLLKSELQKVIDAAMTSGHWDYGLSTRVAGLQNSELAIDRQAANAIVRFIAEHQMTAYPEIPHPDYYLNTRAAEIESSRQAFALVDTALQVSRDHKGPLSNVEIIQQLNMAGLPGNRIAALHAVLVGSADPSNVPLDGSLLIRDMQAQEELRASLLYHAGDYLGNDQYIYDADLAFQRVVDQFNPAFEPRESGVSTETRAKDLEVMAQFANEPPTSIIEARLTLSAGDGITGRGALADDLGIDDPGASPKPVERTHQSAILADAEWQSERNADFRISM